MAHQINTTNNKQKTKTLPQKMHLCSKSIPQEGKTVIE
jgi:hypothetical protein